MDDFIRYSDVLLDAFDGNLRSAEVLYKKRDLIDSVLEYYNLTNSKILFVGFSPWCLAMDKSFFYITEISDSVKEYLSAENYNYEFIPLDQINDKFVEIVIAADEYFTFADSDLEQRNLVEKLAKITKSLLVTTLRDYKNQDFKDREFSHPLLIRNESKNKIYLEHYDYDLKDKNSSKSCVHVISDNTNKTHGPFSRRNMYFKQLAKFSIDAGATNFYVHKNLMYKSIIKKNYEHVITIKF